MATERSLSRRAFLAAAAVGAGAAALAACGQSAASPPLGSAATNSGSSGSTSGSAASGAAPADWQKQWDTWLSGAKKEGKLVMASAPSPAARAQIPEAFKKAFGVEVEYLGGPSSDLANRLRSEQSANQYTVDVTLSGADTTYLVLYGQHMTEPVRPHLIRPDVLDPKVWKHGKVWYMDPEEQYIVRASNYTSQQMWVNTEFIKAEDIKSWHDFLKPEYKGKMAAYDPIKAGSGSQFSAFLWTTIGADFVKALYVDQNTAITQDYRQLSDWLARGIYPIAFAGRGEDNEALKKDGFKVQPVGPFPEAAGTVSAGFGLVNLVKSPPHPNAAKVFLNWILTKDGQVAWNSSQKTVSIRTDVDNSWNTQDLVPKDDLKYFDTYDWDYTKTGWPKANEAVKAILASKL